MAKRLQKTVTSKSAKGASPKTTPKGGGKTAASKTAASKTAASKTAASKTAAKARAPEPARVAKASKRSAAATVPPAKAAAKPGRGSKASSIAPAAPAAEPGTKAALKQQFARLSTATSQIAGLKRSLPKTFFDVGLILNQIRDERLYEVKGYGSFEAFVEREIDINRAVCLRTARIAEAINREDALAAGLERASAAVAALDGEGEASAGYRPAGSPAGAIPLHKQ